MLDSGKPRRTLSVRRLNKEELRIGALLWPERVQRPKTRAQCASVPRPCPYAGCRHHLYLEVNSAGSILFNFPTIEIWQMGHSCTLDIAELGGITLEQVGEVLGITRERVRQIELMGLRSVELASERLDVLDQARLRQRRKAP